jgi:L,D-transpeptidase YcbB
VNHQHGLFGQGTKCSVRDRESRRLGLDAASFELPPASDLPASLEEEASAEIKLDLAILKYARFARGGRLNPRELSSLFDQTPPLRDPRITLADIAAAPVPDAYLRSLHPHHEQFVRLLQTLLKMRSEAAVGSTDVARVILNMERWRWMPEELGEFHVLSNTPEFMLYVVKDGKAIFVDKTRRYRWRFHAHLVSRYDRDCLQPRMGCTCIGVG